MKHTDYENPAKLTITKVADDNYLLEYLNEGEEWQYWASKDELLEEISEHLENMKISKKSKKPLDK